MNQLQYIHRLFKHHQQHSKYLPNQRNCYHHHKPENKNIKFIWTSGHFKINGNELTDHHEKNATLSEGPNKNTAQY